MNPIWTPEDEYLSDLAMILREGERTENRTGTATFREIGLMHKYNFGLHGFPLFTTKKMFWKGIVHELLWFLSGDTNIKYLVDNGINIWNDDCFRWAHEKTKRGLNCFPIEPPKDKKVFFYMIKNDLSFANHFGELGPIYGSQWRSFGHRTGYGSVDQIKVLIDSLKRDPTSRRHIITAWDPRMLKEQALPPCHVLSQFTIRRDNKLWCQLYQRSCDMFLGVPFNVASYSLLTYMIAHVTGLEPGGFIWTGHDCHVYENHVEAVGEQVNRSLFKFPTLKLNPEIKDIFAFKFEDIELENYEYHDTIKADLVT